MSKSARQPSNFGKHVVDTCPDEELAALVATGDETACTELFARYRKRVYLWCFRYTRDAEEAIDCTQDIFIKVFQGISGFRGGSRLSTWIFRVARNYCLSLIAHRGRQWHERLQTLEVDVPDTEWDSQLHELEVAHGLERVLNAAQERMPARELEAYVLHYREGMTVKEITRTMGCENVTGARTLIQNARRKFRRLIARKEFADD
jgi:RNA polymerase sigma-70 factor (ECF subfamily)